MKLVYPCFLRKGESCAAYVVEFPDIAGATQGDTLDEALDMAEDAAALMVTELEKLGKIPTPTPPEKVVVPDGAFMTLIRVDTEALKNV